MVELGAPCGLCCASCKFHITKSCRGCKARDEKCPIWKCAEQKGFRFCAECNSFPYEKNYMVPTLAKQWLDEIKETFKKLENA